MCPPAIPAIISVVGTIASVVGQAQQANAQADMIEAENEARNEGIAAQQEQLGKQYAEERTEAELAAQKERSRLRVLQAEGALQGLSGQRRMDEVDFNLGTQRAALSSNYQNNVDQIRRGAAAGDRTARAQARAIKRPDFLGAGLQIASTVYDYKQQQKKTTIPDPEV